MTLAVMTPLKVKTAVGTYFVQGAADSSVKQYVTITNTHKFSLKVVLASALVLNEDSRSVSATTTVGSVTGGSYPDTGATSQTLVMPANSTVELEFTHTMDATPEDALSAAMRYQVQTPILSVTITEENSVDITDIGPVEYAMGTILYGPDAEAKMASGLVFPTRSLDVPNALLAFFGGKSTTTTRNAARMMDWIENGGNLTRLVEVMDVLSALDAGLPSALTANYSTFADLAAATTAVNATNTAFNSLRTLLASLAIK